MGDAPRPTLGRTLRELMLLVEEHGPLTISAYAAISERPRWAFDDALRRHRDSGHGWLLKDRQHRLHLTPDGKGALAARRRGRGRHPLSGLGHRGVDVLDTLVGIGVADATLSYIATETGSLKATVAGVLRRLERRGLVESRCIGLSEQRTTCLAWRVTGDGRRALAHAAALGRAPGVTGRRP